MGEEEEEEGEKVEEMGEGLMRRRARGERDGVGEGNGRVSLTSKHTLGCVGVSRGGGKRMQVRRGGGTGVSEGSRRGRRFFSSSSLALAAPVWRC